MGLLPCGLLGDNNSLIRDKGQDKGSEVDSSGRGAVPAFGGALGSKGATKMLKGSGASPV